MNHTMLPASEHSLRFYPIGMRHLPPPLQQKAKEELGETEEKIQSSIRTIKKLMQKHKVNLIEKDVDIQILRSLRVRKYNVDKTFSCIKQYTQFAPHFRQRIGMVDARSVRSVLGHNALGILPYKDAEGRAILFYVTGAWDSEVHTPKDVVKTVLLTMFMLMDDPATQVCGLDVIIDARNLTMSEWPYFIECTRSLSVILRADPGRFKRVDVISESALIRFFVSIAKSVLPSKIKERIMFFKNDGKPLLQYYDPSILPHEFGGTLGPLSNDHWMDRVDNLVDAANDFMKRYTV